MIYTYSTLGSNGALGNQLWQIAGVVGHAVKDGAAISLPPDWFYRRYFKVRSNYFSHCDISQAGVQDFSPDYLQDLCHFKEVSEHIKSIFQPTEYAKEQSSFVQDGMTSVHVRRANNLNLPDHHPVPSLDYFEKALDELGNPKDLIVFSDDMGWCREQSIFKEAQFGRGIPDGINVMDLTKAQSMPIESAAIDLLAMTKCNNHIISNSSFSWWGAYLADRGTTIAPDTWYGPALNDINTKGMFPANWIFL
jgi:hypothetical protein